MRARIDDFFAVSQKIAFTRSSCLVYLLPPMACLYCIGVLVQLKGTRYYRLALLPIIVWLSCRGTFVDLSEGDPAKGPLNSMSVTYMVFTAMRGISWATVREPYRRLDHGNESGVRAALWNAWDLVFTTRGIGWNWSQAPVAPKPVLQTESRTAFVLLSAAQSVFHVACSGICAQIVHMLSPNTFGSLDGGSLFDHALPPLLERARGVLVGFLALCIAYFGAQWCYAFLSIVCVVLFQQTPSQWPPLFDAPWRSTSLSDLWGRRWHQMLRQSVVTFSGRRVLGQIGGLLGAFFVSGVVHDLELRAFGKGGNAQVVFRFWLMNGVGVVLERVWKKATGRRVSGVCGWVWTFGWLALWGVPMVDTWAQVGRFGTRLIPVEVYLTTPSTR